MELFGTALRDAFNETYETAIGTAPLLKFRSGSAPATPGTADAGALLCTLSLPSDWMAASSGGVKVKSATAWTGIAVVAAGTGTVVGHYRLENAAGSVVHAQGSVMITGGTVLTCATTNGVGTITAPANTLPNFANVVGAGIQAGTHIVSGGGTTSLVLNLAPLATSASVSLTFTGDLSLDNPNIATGQAVTVNTWSRTAPQA